MLSGFDPNTPLSRAKTLPSSWYLDPKVYDLEKKVILSSTWQPVCRIEQVAQKGSFFSGCFLGSPYLITRDFNHKLHVFHNACRHHAARLLQGAGNGLRDIVCPYHGWTYELSGSLTQAPGMDGAEDFSLQNHGLIPIKNQSWGPYVFLKINPNTHTASPVNELQWLPQEVQSENLAQLCFFKQVEYEIKCNWKIYVDNYLDGGYHVPRMHRKLASELDLNSYHTEIYSNGSVQFCSSRNTDRLGKRAIYAWVYPNFMLNRYGPFLDTNWVIPLNTDRCRVVFNYFIEGDIKSYDSNFIENSLRESDRVMQEDIFVCEAVQEGLKSSSYESGRYSPRFERPMWEFHRRLVSDIEHTY